MDLTGLHALIASDLRMREKGGELMLVQGPPQARRLLELTGAPQRLRILEDPAAAV